MQADPKVVAADEVENQILNSFRYIVTGASMEYLPYLSFLDKREKSMVSLVKVLVNINSHSENVEGIKAVQLKIEKWAKPLKCTSQFLKTPKVKTVDSKGLPITK